jgi:hypothetical protein
MIIIMELGMVVQAYNLKNSGGGVRRIKSTSVAWVKLARLTSKIK